MSSSPKAPGKWDQYPLIGVGSAELRQSLGMPENQKFISSFDLAQAELRSPHSRQSKQFLQWTRQLMFHQEHAATGFEKKALDLASHYMAFQDHAAGRKLKIVPLPKGENQQWISLNELMRTPWNKTNDPSGDLRQLPNKFQKVADAYLAKTPADFRDASTAFLAAVRQIGPKLGPYPAQKTIDLEVTYNHSAPFRAAWVFTLIASLCVVASLLWNAKFLYPAALAAYGAGLVAMCVGFAMRVGISGRAPVTNMYESLLYVGLGLALFGLVLELIHRRRFVLAVSAVIATLALLVADNCPSVLDPSLQPLQPVLRNDYWLVTHVMTIVLSYSAFLLALGIADVQLGCFMFGFSNKQTEAAMSRFIYRCLQVGVILLVVGTFLRSLGRLLLGTLLGLGSEGSLRAGDAADLHGRIARPTAGLAESGAVWRHYRSSAFSSSLGPGIG